MAKHRNVDRYDPPLDDRRSRLRHPCGAVPCATTPHAEQGARSSVLRGWRTLV